ncbi:MAG: CAP domain-containing protein [Actinomycetota bacterium]|nr:CAP domain-containing protein [Actinomycetota bacterium]
MQFVKRLSLATVVALAFGAFSSAPTASGAGCFAHKGAERSFAQKINDARGGAGVRRLQLDKQLSRVARKHSWEMKKRHSLFHTEGNKLGRRVTRWTLLGENVGVGGDVVSLHRAFMDSPAHKANVLRSAYNHVGVGVHRSDNYLWVTIVFEATRDPGTRLRMCR